MWPLLLTLRSTLHTRERPHLTHFVSERATFLPAADRWPFLLEIDLEIEVESDLLCAPLRRAARRAARGFLAGNGSTAGGAGVAGGGGGATGTNGFAEEGFAGEPRLTPRSGLFRAGGLDAGLEAARCRLPAELGLQGLGSGLLGLGPVDRVGVRARVRVDVRVRAATRVRIRANA